MDQELKQRLIGAAVITALAAIFVPMLFDDPIDETGKSINELKIPEIPAKAQEVEIMPLPEKVEDVATPAPIDKPLKPQPAYVDEGAAEAEAELEAPRPQVKLSAKETAVNLRQAPPPEPDMDVSEAEDAAPVDIAKSAKTPATVQPATTAPKSSKPAPAVKAPDAVAEAPAKTPAAAGETGMTRWYLNAGSFGQKANAIALQDSLKQQGFAASLKEVTTDKGVVFKVRVGPMLDKAKAQAVKAKLAQINVNSFVSGDE